MADAVQAALTADPPAPADGATAALALLYARTIDDQGDAATVRDIGPKLLSALEAMQLSPRARALARIHSLTGGKDLTDGAKPAGRLDELRQRRARKRDPQAVDAPAT